MMTAPPLVLIVDDEPVILDVYGEAIEDAGLRVCVAENGDGAIKQALALQPDVIVMDLGMPAMDGLETTPRLKADTRTRSIPVILFTGSDVGDQAQAAGCADVVKKPCTGAVFLEAIRRQLRP